MNYDDLNPGTVLNTYPRVVILRDVAVQAGPKFSEVNNQLKIYIILWPL